LNYLALMGWSHPEGKEIFSLDEYIRVFNLKDMLKTAPVFDYVKLEWMNGEYIRKTQNAKLKTQIYNYYKRKYPEDIIEKTISLIKERIKKLSDYLPLCEFFFKKPEKYEIDLKTYSAVLNNIEHALLTIDNWKSDTIGEKLQEVAKNSGLKTGEFFMVLRVAITGKKISPPLNESIEILGKEECLRRLKSAI
jgi:glutamyl/glutaminyl-tRNA synthetase